MSDYVSIKEYVLQKLRDNLEELQTRFGVEELSLFGSVARGEDTPESDIDILYRLTPAYDSYSTYFELTEYLEHLLNRKVDLISPLCLKPRIRAGVMHDAILCTSKEVEA